MKKLTPKIIWKKTKHSFANIGSDADKDWRIILSFFIVGVIMSLFWHIDLYLNIGSSGNSTSTQGVVDKTMVNTTVLSQMIDTYGKRADEFHIIENNKKVLIDPAQ